jgi:hypothetical protein
MFVTRLDAIEIDVVQFLHRLDVADMALSPV